MYATLDELLDRAEAVADDLMRATGDNWDVTYRTGVKSKDHGWFLVRNEEVVKHYPDWSDFDTLSDEAYAQYVDHN